MNREDGAVLGGKNVNVHIAKIDAGKLESD